LRELYIGKNRITKLENLDELSELEILSIQSNRIVKIEGLDSLVNLQQLYISDNGIEVIEGLDKLENLETLDLASNSIKTISNLENNKKVTEFWVSTNHTNFFFSFCMKSENKYSSCSFIILLVHVKYILFMC